MSESGAPPTVKLAAAPRAGDRLGGRYVLERCLGRGGMGEVWYARDEQGGGPAALKFVRSKDGTAPSPEVRARHLREARAAQRVRNAHVVELYGVIDDPRSGPVLIMQYLEGESLAQRLERDGPLPLGEAARLALELCEGLAAAHAAGVVHRDLKPGNVFLVRDGEAQGGARACIVDFGVAKLLSTTLDVASPTSGGFAGTPLYMAPEQLFGEGNVDHRADVWALGLVLFEALTGCLPSSGTHLGELLRNVLERPMPRARSIVPALPAEVDEALARMLARERRARPPLREVAAAFAPSAGREPPALPAPRGAPPGAPVGETVDDAAGAVGEAAPGEAAQAKGAVGEAAPSGAAQAKGAVGEAAPGEAAPGKGVAPRGRRGVGLKALAAALALGALGVGVRYRAPLREAASRWGVRPVGSFAVIGPSDGLTPERWAARALARLLASRWADAPGLRVVPPAVGASDERAAALVRGDEGAAPALAEALGVEALAVVRPAGAGQIARLEIYPRRGGFRGEGPRAIGPEAGAAELFGAAGVVRERLGLRDGGEASGAALGLPARPEPLAHALAGERLLRAGDVAAARAELRHECAPMAPFDVPALQLLCAQLNAAEGNNGVAWGAAATALAAAGHLSDDDRLALTAEARWLSNEPERGLAEQHLLWAARPEALDRAYRLGEMLAARSRPREANEVFEQVAVALRPEQDDGRVGLQLGLVHLTLGEPARAERELAASLERAERAGSEGVAARARVGLASCLRGVDARRSLEQAERAKAFFAPKRALIGLARAELALAEAAFALEQDGEAVAASERARFTNPIGEPLAIEASALALQADAAERRGEHSKALNLASTAAADARYAGDAVAIVRALNAAPLATGAMMGLPQTSQGFAEALALAQGAGLKAGAALSLQNLARVRLRAGEVARAGEAARASVALYRELGDRHDVVDALDALGLVELASGQPAEARARFEEALRLREGGGRVGGQSRRNLAEALRDEGRLAEALNAGQRAADELRERGFAGPEADALALLAELALDAGDVERARAAAERARSLGDPWLKLAAGQALAPITARVDAARGDRDAVVRLENALTWKTLSVESRPKAQLALGRLWLRGGDRARGRALLTELAAEARRSGWARLANEADRALAERP